MAAPEVQRRRRPAIGGLEVLVAAVAALVIGQRFLIDALDDFPAVQTFATIFVSICLQALPFLVLGVLLSAAITAFVPPTFWQRALPSRPAAAVPVAAGAGVLLPGCECASVPVAGSLVARGVTPAAALAFLLSAPAVNPVVIISTFVAFPGRPEMAAARFLASMAVAMIVGWLWVRFGRGEWLRLPKRRHDPDAARGEQFRAAAVHDMLHAGGFLVVGALAAAALNVLVPRSVLDAVAAQPLLSVLALAALAVVLAVCSEADAFVAASLSQFSGTAQLAFMVVGPVVDLKLIALQSGTFGSTFARRFAPVTFVVAVLCTLIVGGLLL